MSLFLKVDTHTLTFSTDHRLRFKVSVLDHDLLRVQALPEGALRLPRTWMVSGDGGDVPREGRFRDDYTPFPTPSFQVEEGQSHVRLQTQALSLDIARDEFSLTWYDGAGRVFAQDIRFRAYRFQSGGRQIAHYMSRQPQELYYGFGEKAGPLNKHGLRLRMFNLDAVGYDAENTDPLYKHVPFYITYRPDLNLAYGLLYDNFATCTFDMGKELDGYYGYYRAYSAENGDLDYYLLFGGEKGLAGVVEKLALLTGYPVLPPRWSLGYLGSTMSYTEAPDADAQLRQFVDLCRQHDIPCDLFHLSSGYTTGESDGKRYVFNWNRRKVADPTALVDYFHQADIHLSANIKPYLLTTHPRYQEVAAFGGFIRTPQGDAPEAEVLWSGGMFESARGSYLDFTHPQTYAWWQAQLKASLLAYGIDSAWNDNNEFELWEEAALCHGFGTPTPIALLRPVQTLLMVRASYEAQKAQQPERRPFVLSRSGGLGLGRYAQSWSGDNSTSWHTLKWNIPMGLGASLSGLVNTGHDVGGFYGVKPEPELFLRWVQSGIFQPRFTIHSYNDDGSVNEPWMYPDITPLVRQAIRFRYRLIPFLYSLLVEATRTGQPITRPLVYHFAHDPVTHTQNFEFTLGDSLLVAPIYEPQTVNRTVYLPQGTRWHDFYTGQAYEGGQSYALPVVQTHIPLLAQDGALIPMGEGETERLIYAFPHDGAGEGHFTLYEDDGVSMAYQRGEQAALSLHMLSTAEAIRFGVVKSGDYSPAYTHLTFILPPDEKRPVLGAEERPSEGGRRHFIYPI
jgi:alpha-glucosidase